MRVKKLTPIIVSLIVFAVVTAILVRYRSVEAQQDRAAKAPITVNAALQQTEDGGFSTVPLPETTTESNTDLFLDADEVEKRAREEQASGAAAAAAAANPIPVSFKHVTLPLRGGIDHAVAGVAVGRAADDRLHAAGGTDVDRANGELVGVGMLRARENLTDDNVLEFRRAGAVHGFHFEAEKRDRAGDLVDGGVELYVVAEPVEGNFHGED